MKGFLTGVLVLAAVACGHSRSAHGIPTGDGPLVGIYKASIDDGSGEVRGAKVSIWLEPPDRLHAELIVPVSGVTFVLDSGAGHTCLVDVAAATAYVGDDSARAIETLVGIRATVADAVAALSYGTSPSGLSVTRNASDAEPLPETIRLADGGRSLALSLLHFVRGSVDPRTLGTGIPAARLRVLPLESLPVTSAR